MLEFGDKTIMIIIIILTFAHPFKKLHTYKRPLKRWHSRLSVGALVAVLLWSINSSVILQVTFSFDRDAGR